MFALDENVDVSLVSKNQKENQVKIITVDQLTPEQQKKLKPINAKPQQ